ncbi:IS66 family transposase [Roseateles sp. SL47]|uniref:IS66 family transposase n=1 Tax=Roseateles sp. SL47 TaxID=2995138 RepID=UPI002270B0C3|nr:IS66 family transposase [Roseateles sp. SL47]WAC73819.1 IS66 family transposase [Roseateles sp. SL47]
MLGIPGLPPVEPQGLSPEVAALIAQLRQQVQEQTQQLAQRDQALAERDAQLQRKDREIALREAKIEKINFELARLKRWTYGSKSEAMNADQRRLFEETLAEDEAALQAQLERLRREAEAAAAAAGTKPKAAPRKPRRNALPEHLRRVEHRHEPDSTDCQEPGCGRAMKRIGEDVTERLDIVPAEFFVHRHIYGKWACRHCQVLKQAPSVPEIVEGGIAASGFLAHTAISRFVDHLPYYRQESINARSRVHTPRSTLAAGAGQVGAALEPLYELHKHFVLDCPVLHADETSVALLDPGAGKTRKAYMWAYARSWHDAMPGVVYEFCRGRGAQYPVAFLGGDDRLGLRRWTGTLLTDRYGAYDTVVDPQRYPGRISAACAAHARRNFEELTKVGTSPVGLDALRRFARIYEVEGELKGLDDEQRRAQRQRLAKPLWEELHHWLSLERRLVADGGATAKAIDYSLHRWAALTRYLDDPALPIGRVEMWRGGSRSRHRCFRPFRLAVPYEPDRNSVSTSPSSNRTCGFPASGSLPTHQAFAFERPRLIGSRHISPNFW